MTIGFDLGHDLDLEFSRSNMEFLISQPKVVRLPRNEKQTYRLNSRPQMWPMVWIYQIVTGVTSVVGVPSTHLVDIRSHYDIDAILPVKGIPMNKTITLLSFIFIMGISATWKVRLYIETNPMCICYRWILGLHWPQWVVIRELKSLDFSYFLCVDEF